MGRENSIKALNYPPKLTLDMYYTNSFYVEYIKNYDAATQKERYVKQDRQKNFLYFDIGHWDSAYFPIKYLSSTKKLPVSLFKTLQITFLTKDVGDDFCIKNIEFERVKVKSI